MVLGTEHFHLVALPYLNDTFFLMVIILFKFENSMCLKDFYLSKMNAHKISFSNFFTVDH